MGSTRGFSKDTRRCNACDRQEYENNFSSSSRLRQFFMTNLLRGGVAGRQMNGTNKLLILLQCCLSRVTFIHRRFSFFNPPSNVLYLSFKGKRIIWKKITLQRNTSEFYEIFQTFEYFQVSSLWSFLFFQSQPSEGRKMERRKYDVKVGSIFWN